MTDTAPPEVSADEPGSAPRPGRPGPRVPLIPGPIETLGLAWRRLRRMSTALVLLFALAVATLIATFIPQEPVIGSTVREWRDGTMGPGEEVAAVFDALGLFDVFGSWWFAAITVLLFVSLTGCLVPRWRTFARNVRRPAARGTNLTRLSHQARWDRPAGLSDDEVLDRVQRTFRTYRTRRLTSPGGAAQLAVERGHWREAGSLVFHTSFYLLLIGVVLGSAFSFTGQIDIVEGQTFADTPLGYQSQTAGQLWGTEDHRGHLTTIDDFEVTYLDGDDAFTPDEFVSDVTFTDPATGETRSDVIRVNHPAHFGGLTYYQRAFGFAPSITLRSGLDGSELYADDLILRTGPNGWWTGRDKITQGSRDPDRPLPQIAMEVIFIPDARITDDGQFVNESPEPNDPRLLVVLYSGDDLGLDRTVPISQLEWSQDDVVDQAMVVPGEEVGLAGGLFTISVDPELPMWTGLQVSHQPFRWLLLTAASLTLMGLVPSLYAYRRRLWVEVHDDHVLMAGVALHRKARFDDEFESLTERVGDVLHPTARSQR
ncbi:cytochrome c biogenesis protein ResB [Euzebya sp.]|uniref:cytochrome c biogenesis protein ResB n=1 Tax=Euzebya sp. TaxID=1971409 RepID=UPI003517B734